MPRWAHLDIPEIDFQAISYYAAPKKKELKKSMDEVDPELVKTFNKLGISLEEQKHLAGVAVDAVMDSGQRKDNSPREACRIRSDILLLLRGCEGLSRPCAQISGQRGELSR